MLIIWKELNYTLQYAILPDGYDFSEEQQNKGDGLKIWKIDCDE
jgi:hypothetical protein